MSVFHKSQFSKDIQFLALSGGVRTLAILPEAALPEGHPLRDLPGRLLHLGQPFLVVAELPRGSAIPSPYGRGFGPPVRLADFVPEEIPLETVQALTQQFSSPSPS